MHHFSAKGHETKKDISMPLAVASFLGEMGIHEYFELSVI
jgi:hypothetical protein